MPAPDAKPQLFVDLDGTLIKTDLMFESALLLLKQNLLYLALIPFWLLRGRAFLKQQLAHRIQLPLTGLPFNEEFLAFLKQEKSQGRGMTLISAADEGAVAQVNSQLSLFDNSVGSDGHTNLKAEAKLKRIRQLCGDSGFAYAGNSRADLPIWRQADEVLMVNCSPALARQLEPGARTIRQFDASGSDLAQLWQAMRPHQWLKNGLLFLPLLLSHQLNAPLLLAQALAGFVSFCLCASSVYLLNDLLDLGSDRRHESKRGRPFASGELALAHGLLAAPLLLLGAFGVALLLPPAFAQVLLLYWLLTCLYSLYLKRLLAVDVITLALLYAIRVIAGSAAIGVETTGYLIAFSLLLFLGMALVKRVTELVRLEQLGLTLAEGRAYDTSHTRALSVAGGLASLAAVAVFAFYINDPDTTRLYSSPATLWLICPLLLYLLARTWRCARSGDMNEDPVLFAVTDRVSQLIVIACGALVWLAI